MLTTSFTYHVEESRMPTPWVAANVSPLKICTLTKLQDLTVTLNTRTLTFFSMSLFTL
jgi:hypothetical protein